MSGIDPTTPIIAVGIIVALLIFCSYAIFTRQSTDDDQDENSSTRPIDPGRSRGLDSTLIETFPTFIYSEVKHLMIGKDAIECAVCLNEFEDIETLKLLPKCDHVFHSECIGKWLSSRTTCPVCRDDLAEPDAHEQAPVVSDTSTVDRSSITVEVAEESIVDEGGWKKSTNWLKFPRSHSTGHSLVQPGVSVARFTLKLPDEIRNEIMIRASNRTTTSRRVAAAGGGGGELRRLGSLDRPDRWMFDMALPMKLSKSNRLMLMGKNYDASLPV